MAETLTSKVVIIDDYNKPRLVDVKYRLMPQKDGSQRLIVEGCVEPATPDKPYPMTPALEIQIENHLKVEHNIP